MILRELSRVLNLLAIKEAKYNLSTFAENCGLCPWMSVLRPSVAFGLRSPRSVGWKCEVDTLRSFSEGGLPYCFGGFRPARQMAGGRTIGTTGFTRGGSIYYREK